MRSFCIEDACCYFSHYSSHATVGLNYLKAKIDLSSQCTSEYLSVRKKNNKKSMGEQNLGQMNHQILCMSRKVSSAGAKWLKYSDSKDNKSNFS